MSFTKREYIEERVAVWVECPLTSDHTSHDVHECPKCQGELGHWHEEVEVDELFAVIVSGEYQEIEHTVNQDSILVRRWDVCVECQGMKALGAFESTAYLPYMHLVMNPCKHCSVNGESTGAEPGTAGEWEVER